MISNLRLRQPHGFTLIELLVVIAVIGILCSILFPVFFAARRKTYNTVCQNNLKQLYTAFKMYADDWNERLPSPGGLAGDLTYWSQETKGLDVYLRTQHMGSKSVFCCPAYPGPWQTRWSPRTYSMNSFLRDPADIPYPAGNSILNGIFIFNIREPSRTILLFEGIPAAHTNHRGQGYVYRCGDWSTVRGYYREPLRYWQFANEPWHGKRNNYLMADGHIRNMEPERYPEFRGPTSKENNLWYAQRLR